MMSNASKENKIISINHVSFSYGNEKILEDVNLEIEKGTFLALVGPNGSGKSTLTKLILGLIKPNEGTISLFNTPLSSFKAWTKIGYVSQKANSFNSDFPATALEIVRSGLTSKKGLFHFFSKVDQEKAIEAIDAVGMTKFMNKNIGQLSGGQQQRIFIARALVSDPDLLILDEPTVGIDVKNTESFYELLAELNKNHGLTLFMVSHDIGAITGYASQIACLNRTLHFHDKAEKFEKLSETELSSFYGHHVQKVTHNHTTGGQPT